MKNLSFMFLKSIAKKELLKVNGGSKLVTKNDDGTIGPIIITEYLPGFDPSIGKTLSDTFTTRR